jgi:hypothetical protein
VTDFPHAWAELAWKEGHRPYHLTGVTKEQAQERGRKKGKPGENVEKLRKLAATGIYITEAARRIGISPSTAKWLAAKHGIVFQRGNSAEAQQARAKGKIHD